MPAVALPRVDGSMLVGEAADQRSYYEPTLVARTVAPRLGEPGPIVIDGQAIDPGTLTEALIGTAIERASRTGEWPGTWCSPTRCATVAPSRTCWSRRWPGSPPAR